MDGVGGGGERPMLETGLITSRHSEHHFTAGEVVRDVIMGVSDGLTVPFALAAGLSGASAPSSLVLTAGLAEVAAGAISMGLGGYLAAKSEADHFERELKREQEEINTVPDIEAAEIGEIMAQYGLEPHEYGPVVRGLQRKPEAWLDFMMRFELGLEKPDPRRALQSALTIALSYVVGGLVPLMPYMFISTARDATLTRVGRSHARRAALLWLRQGPLHGEPPNPQRSSDYPYWCPCFRCSIWDGKGRARLTI